MVAVTQVSSQAFFELSASSLRIFQRAVQCIAKLGRDAALIFRPEELILHGADDGHSAASQFAFRRRFFRCTPTQAVVQQEMHVVVLARALAVALRGSPQRTAEGLLIGLAGQRLVLEFTRHGGKVRHKVPLLDTSPFLPGEPPAGPHAAALAPGLLARVLDHCVPAGRSSCEEIIARHLAILESVENRAGRTPCWALARCVRLLKASADSSDPV
ncbi:unnamed protein product [Symbiodinium natans]|uniref:Uncharacterized protein n=1 Tax=Symbiodinium natans TaxID=878477 RepID=A0A812I6N1_9DINO|nr:unnamed protein product [Symbiodinium natans]